jgi:TetR/AcrR family transcriptional repressor of nem operon
MGHSQASKKATHERVVSIAARRFREDGIDGLSIADLMKEAGLTHGGFYKHFDSKEQLIEEALTVAFKGAEDSKGTYQSSIDQLITEYLSFAHRDAIGTGCAVSALVNDIGRAEEGARMLYTHKLLANFGGIARLLGGEDQAKRSEAIVMFSTLVGALGLARAVAEDDLSKEILSTVRDALLKDVVESGVHS